MELLLGYTVARGRKMVYMGGRPAGAVGKRWTFPTAPIVVLAVGKDNCSC